MPMATKASFPPRGNARLLKYLWNFPKLSCNAILSCCKKIQSGKKLRRAPLIKTWHFTTAGCICAMALALLLHAGSGNDLVTAGIYDPHAAAETEELLPNVREIVGEIKPGDSLVSSFQANGVPNDVSQSFVEALDGLVNFREMKPSDRYTLTLDDDGSLMKAEYESGHLGGYVAERKANGSFSAKQLDIALGCRTVKLKGRVDSSLYAALSAKNEAPKLIYSFADIFASKIDFNTETRYGDSFELVFEKYYKENKFIGYGKILYARYHSKENGEFAAFAYANGDGKLSYYDEKGRGLGESFIRSPLPMARVSSGFSYNRRHPVLDIVRPHLGVDLAAPTGTPVMAAADGRVSFVGWKGGFGKIVILSHANGYQTYYSHLSRFADKIREGARVGQKQIIGFVGATGIATGPHLDYRIAQNGKFINPFKAKFIPSYRLAGKELVIFHQEAEKLADLARSLDDPKVMLVRNVVVTQDNQPNFL